jgi:dihydrofolate reductase
MRNIVYYVATSIDGFISGPNDDISGFAVESNGVQQYLEDLKFFDTVIMGRKTYEFGYKYGVVPGQPAYPHMTHYIFSDSLEFENAHEKVKVCKRDIHEIEQLKKTNGTDIYLCGGGEFAGWLLDHALIDILKIKLNPLILNGGVKLFGNSTKTFKTELLDTKNFDHGLQIITYKIIYP